MTNEGWPRRYKRQTTLAGAKKQLADLLLDVERLRQQKRTLQEQIGGVEERLDTAERWLHEAREIFEYLLREQAEREGL